MLCVGLNCSGKFHCTERNTREMKKKNFMNCEKRMTSEVTHLKRNVCFEGCSLSKLLFFRVEDGKKTEKKFLVKQILVFFVLLFFAYQTSVLKAIRNKHWKFFLFISTIILFGAEQNYHVVKLSME